MPTTPRILSTTIVIEDKIKFYDGKLTSKYTEQQSRTFVKNSLKIKQIKFHMI